MATVDTLVQNSAKPADCYSFTILLAGFDEITTSLEDAIYEAGCGDAALGMRAGVPYLAFDREADSLEEAIRSAIKDVENVGQGVEVVKVVLPGAEVIDMFNAYLQVRRQALKKFESLGPELTQRLDEFLSAVAANNPDAVSQMLKQE
jgi:hypothetical protein